MNYFDELTASMKEFLATLKQEYELYQNVFALAEKERAAITALKMDDISALLTQKQVLLEKAAYIDERVKSLRAVWKEAKHLIDHAVSQEIEDFLKEFSDLMQKLVSYENENEQLFVAQNEQKEKELTSIRMAKRANKAYFGQSYKTVARNTDKRG